MSNHDRAEKNANSALIVTVTPEDTELSVCESLFDKMRERGLLHLYLITLTGTRAREAVWKLEAMMELLGKRGAIVIELADKTVPDFSLEQLRMEQVDTLVGRFIKRMDLVEDETVRELALQYGLQALLSRDERK